MTFNEACATKWKFEVVAKIKSDDAESGDEIGLSQLTLLGPPPKFGC